MENKRHKDLVIVTVTTIAVGNSTIRPWGNSLGIRIPIEVLRMARLTDGVDIEFLVSDNNEIVMRPNRFPEAEDQESLRALYLSLVSQVSPDMQGHKEQDIISFHSLEQF